MAFYLTISYYVPTAGLTYPACDSFISRDGNLYAKVEAFGEVGELIDESSLAFFSVSGEYVIMVDYQNDDYTAKYGESRIKLIEYMDAESFKASESAKRFAWAIYRHIL